MYYFTFFPERYNHELNEAEKQAQNHAVTITGTPASVAAAAGGGSLGSLGSSGSPPAAVSAAVMAAAVAAESAAMLEAANSAATNEASSFIWSKLVLATYRTSLNNVRGH